MRSSLSPALMLDKVAEHVGYQWCRHTDERRMVFTTVSGSAYCLQASDGEHYLLRQLEGDSLQRLLGFFAGMFPEVVKAKSDVRSRRTTFVLSTTDGERVITTSPVHGLRIA